MASRILEGPDLPTREDGTPSPVPDFTRTETASLRRTDRGAILATFAGAVIPRSAHSYPVTLRVALLTRAREAQDVTKLVFSALLTGDGRSSTRKMTYRWTEIPVSAAIADRKFVNATP